MNTQKPVNNIRQDQQNKVSTPTCKLRTVFFSYFLIMSCWYRWLTSRKHLKASKIYVFVHGTISSRVTSQPSHAYVHSLYTYVLHCVFQELDKRNFVNIKIIFEKLFQKPSQYICYHGLPSRMPHNCYTIKPKFGGHDNRFNTFRFKIN